MTPAIVVVTVAIAGLASVLGTYAYVQHKINTYQIGE